MLGVYKPLVWEYSRLKITHTVMSKRKLKALVEGGHVRGWDDPRMPTLAAMRRRGYTPQAWTQPLIPLPPSLTLTLALTLILILTLTLTDPP